MADFARVGLDGWAAAYGEARADLAHGGGVEAREGQARGRARGGEVSGLEEEVHAHVCLALSQGGAVGCVVCAVVGAAVRTIRPVAVTAALAKAAGTERPATHGVDVNKLGDDAWNRRLQSAEVTAALDCQMQRVPYVLLLAVSI